VSEEHDGRPKEPFHSSSDHQTPKATREVTYDRARRTGIRKGAARKIAEEVARQAHDTANRRGY